MISLQLRDNSLSTQELIRLTFPVLSDVGNKFARQFGIVFELSHQLLRLYRQLGHPLDEENRESGSKELPIPATFLADYKWIIRLAHMEADYTWRLDPEDVIET